MGRKLKFTATTVIFGMAMLSYGSVIGGYGGLMVLVGGAVIISASKFVKIPEDV